ncbi:MAG: J domain-containing protein, partial [Spirochaetes bacterium]|nr:J domain-containing protein [Spirochaetota bacterium]
MEFVFKDYYKILEINDKAASPDIKSAFRRLALMTHPDAKGNDRSYEKFILIREAYDILTSPVKKKEYDSLRKAWYDREKPSHVDSTEHLKKVFEEFDVAENYFYRDEWEFFVGNPGEYLNLFDNTLKMISASLFSLMNGVIATLAVFSTIILVSCIIMIVLTLIIVSFATSSLASVAVILLTIRLYRRVITSIKKLRQCFIGIMAELITRPLKGIPRQIGAAIMNLNYTFAFAVLLFPIYGSLGWAYSHALAAFEGTEIMDYGRNLLVIIISTSLVIVFSPSLVLVFEVIKEALIKY